MFLTNIDNGMNICVTGVFIAPLEFWSVKAFCIWEWYRHCSCNLKLSAWIHVQKNNINLCFFYHALMRKWQIGLDINSIKRPWMNHGNKILTIHKWYRGSESIVCGTILYVIIKYWYKMFKYMHVVKFVISSLFQRKN